MQYNLNDIFKQSTVDVYGVKLDTKFHRAIVVYGIKATKDTQTSEVKIYNTAKGGDHYQEISEDEYDIFLQNGWRYGVYTLSLDNICSKLQRIESNIKLELSGRLNKRDIEGWKFSRKTHLRRYAIITKKLNKLKLKSNVTN